MHGVISAIFRAAVRDRIIPSSPCEATKLPRKIRREVVPLSVEAVTAFANAVSPRYRALVVLCVGTGLRQGEAFGLTQDRVNFLKRCLTVDRQLIGRMTAGHGSDRPRQRPACAQHGQPSISHSRSILLRTLCGHNRAANSVWLLTGSGRTSWPVSRILCTGRLAAFRAAVIHLGLPSPAGSSGLPAGIGRAALNRLRSTPEAGVPFGLAPGGVYRAVPVTRDAGGLLHHRFTLTPLTRGGLFSVALSRGSPRVAVSNHPALRSPDFPRRARLRARRDRPASSSAP